MQNKEASSKKETYNSRKKYFFALGSNLLIKDGKLSLQLHNHWAIIERALKAIPDAKERLEPAKICLTKRKTAVKPAVIPAWQARIGEVRTHFMRVMENIFIPELLIPELSTKSLTKNLIGV